MSWTQIPLSAVASVPWRNGGGMTRELAAWPESENWVWRVSVAEVASDGAFSRFEGVRRWLKILAGTGVRLNVDGEAIELQPISAPFAFSGTAAVYCELLQGPVQDLNLMLRVDNFCSKRAARMHQVSGSHRLAYPMATIVAIFCEHSPVVLLLNAALLTLPQSTLAWRKVPAGTVLEIEAHDATVMEIVLEP